MRAKHDKGHPKLFCSEYAGTKQFIIKMLVLILVLVFINCNLEIIDPTTTMQEDCDDQASSITFETTFGGGILDSATAVVKAHDEGYFLTGFTKKQGKDVLIYQTNLCKETLVYLSSGGGIGSFVGNSIIQTDDGAYLIAGTEFSFLGNRSYVLKINAAGTAVNVWNEIEEKGITINDAILSSNGNYIIGGRITNEEGFGDQDDSYIVLTDANLTPSKKIWFKANSNFYDEVFQVMEFDNGDIAGIGSKWIGFGMRINFVKANSAGIIQDEMTLTYASIAGDNNVYGRCAAKTSDDNIVIAGSFRLIFSSDPETTFLKKINSSGSTIWEKDYSAQSMNIIGNHQPTAVIQTVDGGFLIVGNHNLNNNPDVFLIKTDAAGNHQWDKSYGGSGVDVANGVLEEGDGGFVIVGYSSSFNSGAETGNVYLLKTDSEGNVN